MRRSGSDKQETPLRSEAFLEQNRWERLLYPSVRAHTFSCMMEYMRDFLPDTMVIHAGRRPGLEHFHDREIHLVRERYGGPATTQEVHFSPLEVISRQLKRLGRRT